MLNKAILIGRLTRDPELRSTSNGISVTSFTIC
jgi:single-strand DNA-binding protein